MCARRRKSLKRLKREIQQHFLSVLVCCSSRRSVCFVTNQCWSGYWKAGPLMSCTAPGAPAATPSPAQHCWGAGADTWLCTNAVLLAVTERGAKLQQLLWLHGSSWDSCGISGSSRAGLRLLQQPWKSLSVQDPAPFGEHPVLFAGISCSPSTKGHLSLPPPFYQPSVARPFHGSFTAVTADLLYKIFPPAYFSLLLFLFPNYYYFKLLLLLLFKYV